MVAKCISVSIGVLLACGAGTARLAGQTAPGHDAFYYMTLMNKASAVMLAEGGIVPPALGGKIAKGIEQVDADQAKPGARRPADYLVFEADLLKAAGPDASRLHTGRSRQDMGSTSGRMFLREGLLDTFERLNHARGRVLALAALHQKTIIPAYTHGVQAQPTSLAHYLLAFDAALQRDGERFRAAYADINLSPLGAAALGTSGFAIDRKRLAVLLGFDGVVDNSYDANHWSPQETNLELSNVVAVSAIGVGHFVQDLHTQYHQPVPWIVLKEGPLTGISSIMPQKRNPSALEQLREIGSTVIGQAQTVYFVEHNTVTGMSDYRGPEHALDSAKTAQRMYTLLADVVDALDVRVDRALDEVNGDYSTMTEVADSLLRISDVPFRIGHHFASELANYGRANRKTPKEIPYAEAQRIYKEATEGQTLPLTEAQFKEALSAENMVFNRHGLGGPQLSEIDRMLSEHRARLSSDTAWTKRQRDSIAAATAALDKAFAQLMAKAEGGTFATPTPSTSQAKPAPEDKFLTVGGLRLHYLDWGGAGKPPLLMFHGIARHAHTFDHIAADLSRDYHVIAVDLRGHGDSAWSPDGAYLVEDYVKDLDGLVGQLRLKNLTLLGNSTGGRVAQVFAGMHPELVSAVVVEDVGPERPQDIASGFARRVQEEANGWASEDELVAQLVKQNARTPEPLLRTYAHYGLKPRADGRMIWKRDPNLVKGFVVTELWQHVSRITAPTIYILGGASTIVPADTQQRLKKTLPRVEIVTMPGLGHYPDSEDAAGFMAILNRFLKRS